MTTDAGGASGRRPSHCGAADGPLDAYRALRKAGRLKPDPAQELAVEKLETLSHRLRHYRPGGRSGWKALLALGRRAEPPPQGLYLYGGVGRGKSMLMDLFFEQAPVTYKRRVHFHAFMQEVHAAIHAWRQSDPATRGGDDPIPPLARDIAEAAWLLCFDEFQVTDVADAMILGRLFEKLFERGVVVVATSNRPPDDLYLGGINRPLFLPFIALLKHQLDVLELAGGTDYRLARLAGRAVYHMPLDAAAEDALDQAFADLTDDAVPAPAPLDVQGRTLALRAAHGVLRTSFAELCERPLGPADYLAVARRFHTVVLSGIPALEEARHNTAKRLGTLIDTLYEARCKLICSAAVAPDDLFPEGIGSFEFRRTASRLAEMQSAEYMALPHRGE